MYGTAVHWASLVGCILAIITGLILSIIGVFSPTWQVSDLKEFQSEHQHGLWQDCVRRRFLHLEYSESTPTCMYKFDTSAQQAIIDGLNSPNSDAAAYEAEHHLFSTWHKVILSLIIMGQFSAFLAIFAAAYAFCYRPAAVTFTVALLIALILSLIADGIFFISAMRVDVRFVQAAVGTYEQKVGHAFYIHLLGTAAFGIAFLLAMFNTFKRFSKKSYDARSTTLPSTNFSSNVRYRSEHDGDPPLIDKYTSSYGRRQFTGRQLPYHITSA